MVQFFFIKLDEEIRYVLANCPKSLYEFVRSIICDLEEKILLRMNERVFFSCFAGTSTVRWAEQYAMEVVDP